MVSILSKNEPFIKIIVLVGRSNTNKSSAVILSNAFKTEIGGRVLKDTEIIELLLQRDEEALKEIDLRFGSRLKCIIRNIIKDEEDVLECLNDVYMKVWDSIPPTKPDNLEAYLRVISRNVALDRYKTKSRKSDIPRQVLFSIDDDNFPEQAGPELTDETVEKTLKEEKIHDLLIAYTRAMPPNDQRLFVARYFYDMKIRTIANHTGMPVGTVKSALHRIKTGILAYLKKEGIEND